MPRKLVQQYTAEQSQWITVSSLFKSTLCNIRSGTIWKWIFYENWPPFCDILIYIFPWAINTTVNTWNTVFTVVIVAICDVENTAQLVRQDVHGLLLALFPLCSPPTAPALSCSLQHDELHARLLKMAFDCKWMLNSHLNLTKTSAKLLHEKPDKIQKETQKERASNSKRVTQPDSQCAVTFHWL